MGTPYTMSSIVSSIPLSLQELDCDIPLSKDKEWAYVQTPFIRGWVRLRDLAIAKEKSEVKGYEEAKSRLLVTGNIVSVFGDPFFRQPVFLAQMGDSFPLLSIPNVDK